MRPIAVEEAWAPEHIARNAVAGAPSYAASNAGQKIMRELMDIHDQRLAQMDMYGIGQFILSLTSPGPQGCIIKEEAEEMARKENDRLAKECKMNPNRFFAVASLSMHDPVQAGEELTRAVKELGMHGCILNDFQQVGDKETMKWYDEPEYDAFWEVVQKLDVPVYIHPRVPTPETTEKFWKGRRWLNGAALSFTFGVAMHLLGICVNGVFDRFPGVKVIIGHGGETIPYNLWRTDHRLNLFGRAGGMPMKKNLRHYFAHNIYITTSGHFSTPALICAITEIGADRILYAIDTPYESLCEGADWWNSVTISETDKLKIGRKNAIDVFKLPLEYEE